MNKCGGCGKFLSGGAACSQCKAIYHRQCVNLTTNQTLKQWVCPCCIVSAPRKDNTDTPVKQSGEQQLGESPEKSKDSVEQNPVLEELRALRNDMNAFRKDFGCFREEVRDELKDLRGLYTGCMNKMNTFSDRLENQESRLIQLETSCMETQNLKLELHILRQELKEREQIALQNDVEISGVTEHGGENIMHITELIMSKIGIKLEVQDVVDVHRVSPIRMGEGGNQRARPIVMRVTRRALRDQVLRCARTRRNISTADVDMAGSPRPIYINERLTKDNRLLFSRARTLCREHKWKFAWTREGKVFIREGDGKQAFRVRCEEDITKMLKQHARDNNL